MSGIGQYMNDTIKPIQNDEHSGHNKGLLIYGILAIMFLTGRNISVMLHMYERDNDIKIKIRILFIVFFLWNIHNLLNSYPLLFNKHFMLLCYSFLNI